MKSHSSLASQQPRASLFGLAMLSSSPWRQNAKGPGHFVSVHSADRGDDGKKDSASSMYDCIAAVIACPLLDRRSLSCRL